MARPAVTVDDAQTDSLSRYLAEIGSSPLLTAEEEVELAQAIESGIAAETSLLTADSPTGRRELIELAEAGRRAKDRFLESNLRLVVSIAKKYRTGLTGTDLLDLIQEGNLGLVRAVEKFDWRKGFKFSTYATWWIRQAVSRALLEKGRPIRVPPRVHDAAISLKAVGAQFQAEVGRTPTIEELVDRSGISRATVEEALSLSDIASLEAPVGEEGAVLGDFIETDEEPSPEQVAIDGGISRELMSAIARLGEREQIILRGRFGFDDNVPRTRAEIGASLGLSAERIHQLEKRALCVLRHPAFGLKERDLY